MVLLYGLLLLLLLYSALTVFKKGVEIFFHVWKILKTYFYNNVINVLVFGALYVSRNFTIFENALELIRFFNTKHYLQQKILV